VPTPEVLRPAVTYFVASLDGYIAAANDFRAAALAPAGPERDRLVGTGIDRAEAADDTYDKGGFLVQDVRRSVGLPESDNFPRRLDG
jgi:hypothetical protein